MADYGAINSNRLVFAAAQINTDPGPEWCDGRVFITDASGAVIRQRAFLHSGDSISTRPVKLFCSPTTIELFSMEGPVSQTCFGQVSNKIRWVQMDTALNILSQRVIAVTTGDTLFFTQNVVRLNGSTYLAGIRIENCAVPFNWKPFLLRFDPSVNLVLDRTMDSAFYNTTLSGLNGYIFDISAHAPSHTLWVTARVTLDSAANPSFFAGVGILHKLDTSLNLLDTFIYSPSSAAVQAIDTSISDVHTDVLPLDSNRVWLGSSFHFSNVVISDYRKRIGLTLYTPATGEQRRKFFAPLVDNNDEEATDAWVKSIASAPTSGTVYALGSSHQQFTFQPFDNKLIVVKYDTAGNLLWHRFIGPVNAYYSANGIYADGDSAVTITATRFEYGNGPAQREFYVVRLRSTDGEPTAVFNLLDNGSELKADLFPNPVGDVLYIRLPHRAEEAAVTLYAASGATVREVAFSGTETSVSMEELAPGIYFYQLRSDGHVSTGQFVKQ